MRSGARVPPDDCAGRDPWVAGGAAGWSRARPSREFASRRLFQTEDGDRSPSHDVRPEGRSGQYSACAHRRAPERECAGAVGWSAHSWRLGWLRGRGQSRRHPIRGPSRHAAGHELSGGALRATDLRDGPSGFAPSVPEPSRAEWSVAGAGRPAPAARGDDPASRPLRRAWPDHVRSRRRVPRPRRTPRRRNRAGPRRGRVDRHANARRA